MIAAFLGMRLYSVLGKRTGHEQEPVLPRERTAASPVRLDENDGSQAPATAPADTSGLVYEPAAEAGLRQLLASDRNFDAGRFMEGAEAAYRMILEAYWKGDRDTLRDLCDDDSYEAFADAIAARESRGETLDNRLMGIDSAKITAVELNRSEARVTVRYHADISAVTRDADGKLIAGSMSDASQTDDLWTFRRQIGSNDPNWVLDEAESA
ncbi:preprotein translocase subunit Tim44 [Sphingopyxis sp. H038]|nr:preprotein translocase subunit Tim44 [Sphingopyxis sp. H012]KTE09426.1 preprotein translocase subunit Tim44 [Sphingopyxis sp. H053]KTE14945.1 preprotein translocase subunit Tim44 [Sphingopyxis sp. H093]KTE29291.1 preprotein translocase subunit Tim44 [Sphingopyxis sp. H080]KTE35291.1 preprotein translocase subunit Tim44 [Sphingopyxis sp. H038]KTE44157.1 preprotein translocase subunit Tim44 [Sphingopyxis sp. H005]KTE47987.1 preprotein translocase subunit Tim44 [Sphingopyxis sp. H077]KTE6931